MRFKTDSKRWIVQREIDGRFLTVKNCWNGFTDPHNFKLYKRQSAALKALERYGAPEVVSGSFSTRGRILAVYDGDWIDCDGALKIKLIVCTAEIRFYQSLAILKSAFGNGLLFVRSCVENCSNMLFCAIMKIVKFGGNIVESWLFGLIHRFSVDQFFL